MASSTASGIDVSTKLDLVLKVVEDVKRNDPDITFIAYADPFSEGEMIMDKAHELIVTTYEYSCVTISGACRLESRIENKPGLVTISCNNRTEKVNSQFFKNLLGYI